MAKISTFTEDEVNYKNIPRLQSQESHEVRPSVTAVF